MNKNAVMLYDPQMGARHPYPSHAAQYREWHNNPAWLYNPWTGVQRKLRHIAVDPEGHHITDD
jgi:hypothetical protein